MKTAFLSVVGAAAFLVVLTGAGAGSADAQTTTIMTRGTAFPTQASRTSSLATATPVSTTTTTTPIVSSSPYTMTDDPPPPSSTIPAFTPDKSFSGVANTTGLQIPASARSPKEGETGADGKVVHYEMAGKEPNMGTGVLSDVELPKRVFNNVEPNY